MFAVLIEGEKELMVTNIILALYSENISGVYYWHHYQNGMIPLDSLVILQVLIFYMPDRKQQSAFGLLDCSTL